MKMKNKIVEYIKNLFMKKNKSTGTADLSVGFYPEILFLINKPYAEYIDYEEV